MESLYRKYRPLTFESVVGQQHIVSTLEHAVAEGRLSHAYLFCGPRGTGKTTMARILAKALLCERSEAARAEGASGCMACGTCPECTAIAEGGHPDVYELDAASRTGVDNVREEIINSVSFAPVRGAYKVYIIDEVHMLTTAAFNALLKTLEEPPSHVVFVLCTTDPQKLPETILSRCQRFDFHRISNEEIVGRMRYICEQEQFACDDEALELVARHARGGMRDALSTLEQLSVFGGGAVRSADARALLGEVASTVLADFAEKIARRDTPGLFGMVRDQAEAGGDVMELTRDLVGHLRDVYTAAIAGPRAELFDGTPEEVAAFVEEARLFGDADRLARALMVLDDAALEMRNASDPRLVLEIACTRLARPEADMTLEALAERVARLEAQLAAGVPSAPTSAAALVGEVSGRDGASVAGGDVGAAAAGAHGGAAGVGTQAGAGADGGAAAVRAGAAAAGAASGGGAGAAGSGAGARVAARGGVPSAGRASGAPAGVAPWERGSAGGPAAAASAAAGTPPWERGGVRPVAAVEPAVARASEPAPGAPARTSAAAPMPEPVVVADAPATAVKPGASAPAAPAAAAAGAGGMAAAPISGSVSATVVPSAIDNVADHASADGMAAAAPAGSARESAAGTLPSSNAPAAAAAPARDGASIGAKMAGGASSQAAPGQAAPGQAAPADSCAETPAVDDAGELQRKWAEVIARVVAAQPSRGALLQSSRAQHDDGAQLTVAFPKGSAFAIKMVGRPDSQAVVLPIVCEVFGQRTVAYVMDGGDGPASTGFTVGPAVGGAAPSAVPASASTGARAAAAASTQMPTASGPASVGAGQTAAPARVGAQVASAPDAVQAAVAAAPAGVPGGVPAGSAQGQPAPASASMPSAASAPVATTSGPSAAPIPPAPTPAASATGSAPAAPAVAPAAHAAAPCAEVDQVSGPTIVPEPDIEAQRKAWEDEPVPYDDAMIDAYDEDDEVPPFDAPAAPAAECTGASVPASQTGEMAGGASAAGTGSSAPAAVGASPAEAVPWAAQPDMPEGVPQTKEEAEDLLSSIFGAGVVVKPAE